MPLTGDAEPESGEVFYQVRWYLQGYSVVPAASPEEATAWTEGWLAGRGMSADMRSEIGFEVSLLATPPDEPEATAAQA